MPGTMVSFRAGGRTASGYLAASSSGKGPGVVVIQEIWGLTDHIKDVCERFARAGFVALAPNLYDRDPPSNLEEARGLMSALDLTQTSEDLRGAAQYLASLAEVAPDRVAAVGFCMGGQLALLAATEHADIVAAAVDFYGIHAKVKPDFAKLSGPVLAHFGKHDPSVTEANARTVVVDIENAGKQVEAHFYETGHAFFNDTRPDKYDAASADAAWDRTLQFLRDTFNRV